MDKSISIKRLSADSDSSGSQWAAVRELCCRAANNGAGIAAERWPLFGEIWIEPYRKLLSDWSYVALFERESGRLSDRLPRYRELCPPAIRPLYAAAAAPNILWPFSRGFLWPALRSPATRAGKKRRAVLPPAGAPADRCRIPGPPAYERRLRITAMAASERGC